MILSLKVDTGGDNRSLSSWRSQWFVVLPQVMLGAIPLVMPDIVNRKIVKTDTNLKQWKKLIFFLLFTQTFYFGFNLNPILLTASHASDTTWNKLKTYSTVFFLIKYSFEFVFMSGTCCNFVWTSKLSFSFLCLFRDSCLILSKIEFNLSGSST